MGKYAEPVNEIVVSVPVVEATMKIELLDVFDKNVVYEHFLLFIGNKKRIEDLVDITVHSESQISMIIDELTNWNLIYKNEEEYSFTESGQYLFKLIEEKHGFNDVENIVLINCFTGNVEMPVKGLLEQIPGKHKLSNKVNYDLFGNLNQGGSREVYAENFRGANINDEDMKIINLEVDIKKRDVLYINKKMMGLPELITGTTFYSIGKDVINIEEDKTSQKSLLIKGKVIKFIMTVEIEKVSMNSAIIETLKQVYSHNSAFLSDEAIELLELDEKQQKLNKQFESVELYLDTFTGTILNQKPYIFSSNRREDISFEAQYGVSELGLMEKRQLAEMILGTESLDNCKIGIKFLKELYVFKSVGTEILVRR